MISKRTVLVTGAGASVPYGFPTSTGLREMILGDVRDHLLDPGSLTKMLKGRIWGDHTRINLQEYLEWCAEEVDNHLSLLPGLQAKFKQSAVNSIDSFLRFEDNKQFGEVGRALIAGILLACEHIGRSKLEHGWYAKLWNYLVDAEPRRGFDSTKLAVVTFNYERSLQHYLTEKAKHTSSRMEEIVKGIKFEHVYGSLGSLNGTGAVKYGDVPNSLQVNGIKLMHPRIEPNPVIRSLLVCAERIVFLGFGFNQMNIDALELQILEGKEIWASCYKLDANSMANVEELLVSRKMKRSWGNLEDGVENFLHKNGCLY